MIPIEANKNYNLMYLYIVILKAVATFIIAFVHITYFRLCKIVVTPPPPPNGNHDPDGLFKLLSLINKK